MEDAKIEMMMPPKKEQAQASFLSELLACETIRSFRDMAGKSNSVEELKKILDVYEQSVGKARKRLDEIETEFSNLTEEKRELENKHGFMMEDLSGFIKFRIGEVVCSAS